VKPVLKGKLRGLIKRKKLRYLLKYVFISIFALIIVTIASYLSGIRWAFYLGTVIVLICVWIMAIINYDSILDKKAMLEAEKMVRKKKYEQKMRDLDKPDEFAEALEMKHEPSVSLAEKELKEPEFDKDINEIIGLKKELGNIELQVNDLRDKQKLYRDKITLIDKEIITLDEQRKELKNKILELI